MGNRNGRRPLPTAVKAAEGNRSKVAAEKLDSSHEPQFPKSTSRPPYLDGEAAAEWDRVYPFLAEQGLITVADETALASYCTIFARWLENERELKKDDLAIETEKGTIYQNPRVGISNTLMENMRKFMLEFGMTPAARAKLGSGKANDPSEELRKFLEMKQAQKKKAHEKRQAKTEPVISDFEQ